MKSKIGYGIVGMVIGVILTIGIFMLISKNNPRGPRKGERPENFIQDLTDKSKREMPMQMQNSL